MLEYVILHQANAHVMLVDMVLIVQVSNLVKLAYMATSGGHFSRPSGMGSFWSCNSLNNSEGMTSFGRNDTNTEGMTKIRKE